MIMQIINRHFLGILLRVFVEALIKVRGMVFLIIITRFMGLEEYGIWSQINITIFFLVPLITLQLPIAVIRFFHHEKLSCSRFFFPLAAICVGFNIVVSFLALSNREYFARMLFDDAALTSFVLPMMMLLFVNSLNNLIMSFFRGANRFTQISNFQIAFVFLDVSVLSAGLLLFDFSLLKIIYLIFLVNIVETLVLIVYMNKSIGIKIINFSVDINSFKQYILFSIPLVPHAIFTWIMGYSDRFFILHYHGIDVVGLYNAVYTIAFLMFIIQLCFNYVVFPVLSRHWDDNRLRMETLNFNYTQLYGALAGPCALTLVLLGPIILTFMKIEVNFDVVMALVLIVVAFIIAGLDQFFRNMLQLSMRTRVLPVISLSAALVNLALNILLIPWLGIVGGAIAILCTYLAQFVFVIIAVNQIRDFRPELYSLITTMAVISTLGCVGFFVGQGLGLASKALLIFTFLVLSLLYVYAARKLDLKLLKETSDA